MDQPLQGYRERYEPTRAIKSLLGIVQTKIPRHENKRQCNVRMITA